MIHTAAHPAARLARKTDPARELPGDGTEGDRPEILAQLGDEDYEDREER
ncbi:MAG TPA: hypothetical protein VFR85_08800 [Anaeromyxobacteraceae bacterium]|nr:hypothetical protein [Anaeromyxobacteraceae bacterium]